jgi:putative NADH-flavin reductase
MKLFILGGTGNSGQRLVRMALHRSHQVTVFVRDREKLVLTVGRIAANGLNIITGAIDERRALAAAMSGHDAVINAAGNVNDGPSFTRLVRTVIGAAAEALGADGRLWLFGGAALLDVPGERVVTLDLPMIPPVYEAHRINLEAVRATKLDWSMLCPGPMIGAPDGKPTEGLRLSEDQWPVERPTFTYFLPRLALSVAFRQKISEMTISYEDAAEVILDHLAPNDHFSRKRVGVALPIGLKRHKRFTPGSSAA